MNIDNFQQWVRTTQKDFYDEDDMDDILHPKNAMHNHIHRRLRRKYNKMFFRKRSYLYLTLSPDKHLRNLNVSESNKLELEKWCKSWFEYNPKYYGDYAWVIEGGSKNDHLHVHAVVELLSSHKHADKLKKSWARRFPNNQLITTLNLQTKGSKRGEYAYLQFDREEILRDKLAYFKNENKSSHENLVDLGLAGSRGFLD